MNARLKLVFHVNQLGLRVPNFLTYLFFQQCTPIFFSFLSTRMLIWPPTSLFLLPISYIESTDSRQMNLCLKDEHRYYTNECNNKSRSPWLSFYMKVHNTLFVHNNNNHTHQLHSVMTHFFFFRFFLIFDGREWLTLPSYSH